MSSRGRRKQARPPRVAPRNYIVLGGRNVVEQVERVERDGDGFYAWNMLMTCRADSITVLGPSRVRDSKYADERLFCVRAGDWVGLGPVDDDFQVATASAEALEAIAECVIERALGDKSSTELLCVSAYKSRFQRGRERRQRASSLEGSS